MGENVTGPGESAPQTRLPQAGRANTRTATTHVPVLAAVIRRGGRYLVGRRPAHKRHGGLWEFPGGKLKAGESWLEAARRELGEELGVQTLDVGRMLYRERDPGSDFVIVFVEVVVEGEPESREHDVLRWASPAELRGMELAPADAAFVSRLPEPVSEAAAVERSGEHD